MDDFKQQIQRRLIANVIMDKCAHSEHVIFRDAWCTQERVIRFTTPFFRRILDHEDGESGKWETGDKVMYEVNNGAESFVINCMLCTLPVRYTAVETEDKLVSVCGAEEVEPHLSILKSWDLTDSLKESPDKLFESFDDFLEIDVPAFEDSLAEKLITQDSGDMEFREGTAVRVVLNKYERNPKARAACLAAHGTACVVCGMDFGKVYGPAFADKIEVHHLVPISEIGKEYVVDPVKDLVPVCPNCHMALHSKKDGVYTIEELKALLKKN